MWVPPSSVTVIEAPKKFILGGKSPRTVAHALAYIQSDLYYNILPPDFVQWSQNLLSRSGRNGIAMFTMRSNQIGYWVLKSVLETNDLRRRAEIVEFFIHTAKVRTSVILCIRKGLMIIMMIGIPDPRRLFNHGSYSD